MPHKMFGVRRTPFPDCCFCIYIFALHNIKKLLQFLEQKKKKIKKQKQKKTKIFAAFILTSHKSQPKFQGPKKR